MEFIKCAGSLATAEYPLLSSDDEMDQYVVKTYTGVQFVEDLQQSIVMPSFDGWSECNMVRLTQTNQAEGATAWKSYYWITNAVRSSDVDGCTTFYLEFDAVTSLLKVGDKVNGQWLRSPVNYTPWKQQNVISGTMGLDRTDTIMPFLPFYGNHTLIWVSVTASKSPDGRQGCYEIYGFPIIADTLQDIYDDSSYIVYGFDSSDICKFPTLQTILNGRTLEGMGLNAEEILDISISPYSPFASSVYNLTIDETTYLVFGINNVSPVKIAYTDGSGDTAYGNFSMFNITSSNAANNIQINEQTTVCEYTQQEQMCGQISIMKGDGSICANIPNSWILSDKLTVKSRVICDFMQMLIEVRVMNTSGIGDTEAYGIFTFPCDHIPYMGNSWDSYRAYSMSYDREAMEFSIDQAKQDRDIAVAKAAVGTVGNLLSGNIGGAINSAAEGVSAYYQQAKQEKATRFNQDLSERRTQGQPGNAYGANYGIFGLYMSMTRPMSIALSMPVNLTTTKFLEYVKNFGYANEGKYEQTMQYGFYQGTVYTSPTMTGPRFDGMINSFNAGIRLISPSGNT